MRKIFAFLIVALLACGSADARPVHWYKDWKFIAGLAAIGGSLYANQRSTCEGYHNGFVEGNFVGYGSHSCGAATGILIAGGAVYSGLHYWMWRESWNESSTRWNIYSRVAIPAIACGVHCTAAAVEFNQRPQR